MSVVHPTGNLDSKFVIVGARPGAEEIQSGLPFVGASGKLLWKMAPFSRDECYVTNVRQDFSSTHPTPTRAEINEALPTLKRELLSTTANIIIALGSDALFALTSKDSVDIWRGSVLESTLIPGRKVIGTYHPAACLRTWSLSYVMERDLRRARREIDYSDIRRPRRTFLLAPNLDDITAYLRKLKDPISVDIETFGETISCVAISDSPNSAICLPFIGSHLTDSELVVVFRELDTVFRTRGIIGQNIQFDTTRLEALGFSLPNIHFDTMLAHHLLWPELGSASKRKNTRGIDDLTGKHDLGFLVSIYTDEPYYKHEANAAWTKPGLSLEDRFLRYWTYNCKDAACTYEVYLGLRKELETYGQMAYYKENVLSLIRPVMAMQARGLCVDFDALNKIRARLRLEVEYLQLSLDKEIGVPINVRSSSDIRFLLYDLFKLRNIKLTKGGSPSTDEETLRTLAYRSEYAPTFRRILDIRERRTLLSSFLELETNDQGRYQASYLIHGTDSGRLSSRAYRKGPQTQNIPKATRKIFIASPGCVLIQGDLRRAEAMYVAYDAQEGRLIALFDDPNRDLYKEVAATSLGKDLSSIETWEREVFKRVCHAANYGMGKRKLVIVLRLNNIDIEDIPVRGISGMEKKAEFLLESYHASYPNIRRWQKKIAEEVSRTRTLFDAFNRRRVFLGRMDESLVRVALSYRPQASIVGLTNRALRLLHGTGQPILLQVHDSIVMEVPEEQLDDYAMQLEQAMICPLQVGGRELVIPVDLQHGTNWGELKAYERNTFNTRTSSVS